MAQSQNKDPRVFWTIVGICFGIVVLAWLPLAFQKISSFFGALQQTSIISPQLPQELVDLKDNIENNQTSTSSAEEYFQSFTKNIKEILTSTSSSSTDRN